MIPAALAHWTTQQWATLAAVLLAIIVVLLMLWPRGATAPDSFVVRVVNGPTVISTQVIPLNRR